MPTEYSESMGVGCAVMQVTKLDGEVITVNENQVKHISFNPGIKVVLTTGDTCFVKAILLRKNDKRGKANYDTVDQTER